MPSPPQRVPADVPVTLAAALAALQSEMPKVQKANTATVRSDKGNYQYTYADLEDCAAAIYPKMGPLGLSFNAKPTWKLFKPTEDAAGVLHFVLEYTLRHAGGESDSGDYPLPDPLRSKPQEMGSAISYARRYSLCAVTGLAPGGDDDDAQAAQAAARRDRQEDSPYGGHVVGSGQPPRDWIAESEKLADVAALLDLGRQCNAVGQFVGPVKSALLARRQKLEAVEPPAEPAVNGATS